MSNATKPLYKPGDVVNVVTVEPDIDNSIWITQMNDTLGEKVTIKSIYDEKYHGEFCYAVRESGWVYQESFFTGLTNIELSDEADNEVEIELDGLDSFISAFAVT